MHFRVAATLAVLVAAVSAHPTLEKSQVLKRDEPILEPILEPITGVAPSSTLSFLTLPTVLPGTSSSSSISPVVTPPTVTLQPTASSSSPVDNNTTGTGSLPPIITPPTAPVIPTEPSPPPVDNGACLVAGKYIGVYHNVYYPECLALIADCREKTKNTDYIWSKTSCVAAAACSGTRNLVALNQCRDPTFPNQASTPHLSYNLYADIVGNCAWDDSGCAITKQKFVDWFYGALSNAGTTSWPRDIQVVVERFWQPILDWTKTGNTLPYTNFNDWLHYSNSS